MKNKILIFLAFFMVFCTLVLTGCPEETQEHNNPALLIGKWENARKGISFEIYPGYSFVCDLKTIDPTANYDPNNTGNQSARVTGFLDYEGKELGPNDYFLRNMSTSGSPAEYPGNAILNAQLPQFSNLIATLTPYGNVFTFESSTLLALIFFGGQYTKVN